MRSNRKARKILKAFGKESYKERIKYVDSFLPGKTSFVGSISYRHTLKRVGMAVLLIVLIAALAVSAYAAAVHFLNYNKEVHPDNDEYIPINENSNDYTVTFYEPMYIPPGYELELTEYNEDTKEKCWLYYGPNEEIINIFEMPYGTSRLHIDNEHTTKEPINIGNLEGILYDWDGELLCLLQYDDTVFEIIGIVDKEEMVKIVKGLNIPE